MDSSPALADSLPVATARVLSARLRTRTAFLHEQIEVLFRLPSAIRSRDDYVLWLSRFLGIYGPLDCPVAASRP
jgi:heme oxygenase